MSLKCIASQWAITVDPESWVHQYQVNIKYGPEDLINEDLDKSTKDVKVLTRCLFAEQYQLCRHIISNLPELKGLTYVYDNHAFLITNKQLKSDIKIVRRQVDLDNYLKNYLRNQQAFLKIQVTKVKSIKFDEFPTNAATTLAEDRTWRNACEVILSEFAVTRAKNPYVSIGSGLLCEMKKIPFEWGLYSRDGNRKGVEVIQGSNGPQLCVSMDFRRKVLYPDGIKFLHLFKHVMTKCGNDFYVAETLFRNVKLYPIYQPERTLIFKNFTFQNVGCLRLDDGRTLEAFYLQWNIQLQNLNEPAAQMSNTNGYFPLELLEIFPNQTVPLSKMSKRLKEEAVKLNRVEPNIRFIQIKRQFENLSMNNEISAAFGIKVDSKMIQGSYQRRPRMKMILDGITVFPNEDGFFEYNKNKYYKAAGFDEIIVFSNKRERESSMKCVNKIVFEAKKKGMQMPNPIFQEFNTFSQNLDEWIVALKEYKERKAIVMVVDPSSESHLIVKLAQARTCVQTQHLQSDTAFKVSKGRPKTLENIVHKMNVKSGGINHIVDFGSHLEKINLDETLIISLDVCHPTALYNEEDEPSTVGLVSNYLANPHEFAGIFFFQSARQESVDQTSLQINVKKMLQQAKNHRKCIKNVIVIRDGISEGQYAMFVEKELAAIDEATTTELSIKPKMVGIIVTKDGIVRHFMDYSSENPQSMPPRSFVSFGCRYGFRQFYQISHKAGIGTAKSVLITVLRDDLQISDEELQTFLLGLTQLHQIISFPVSIPAPLYQADVLAEHGQKLFVAMKRFCERDIPRIAGAIDYNQLSNLLNFNNGELPLTRYTA
uniref:Piwi domain-containing protein n=1 Tax=Panagrolaimus sp. PS1159 TaxID=55785 RepID=A0AC35EZ74_9BILA